MGQERKIEIYRSLKCMDDNNTDKREVHFYTTADLWNSLPQGVVVMGGP